MISGELIMLYAIPVFFVSIAIEFIWGVWIGKNEYHFSDTIANLSCGIVQQLFSAVLKIIGFGLYYFLWEHYRVFSVPSNFIWAVILFILIDFLYYWFHRFSHEINIFWSAHVVHHQSEYYNLSVALRQSAFQTFVSSVFYLPLALVGFSPLLFGIIGTFQTLYQFWIHTKHINKMPSWFEYLFNTPSHHRVHHGKNPEYIDKNHGGTLIVFDRIFGTFQKEEATVVFGVTKNLKTWNPIWANFDYVRDLWATSIRSKGIGKLTLFYERPSEMESESFGNKEIPLNISRETLTQLPIYLLLQFSVVLGFSVYFLMFYQSLPNWNLIILLSFLFFSLSVLGSLADQKQSALLLEGFRLLFLIIVVYLLFGTANSLVFWIAICFAALSYLGILVRYKFN